MTEYDLGTVVSLMCDRGFDLVGDPRRTCEDDDQADTIGVWSGTTTCQREQSTELNYRSYMYLIGT